MECSKGQLPEICFLGVIPLPEKRRYREIVLIITLGSLYQPVDAKLASDIIITEAAVVDEIPMAAAVDHQLEHPVQGKRACVLVVWARFASDCGHIESSRECGGIVRNACDAMCRRLCAQKPFVRLQGL